jgi:hypothetical protein
MEDAGVGSSEATVEFPLPLERRRGRELACEFADAGATSSQPSPVSDAGAHRISP